MKTEANGAAGGLDHADKASSALDGSAPDPTDLANYFCTYAYIYHVRSVIQHASGATGRGCSRAYRLPRPVVRVSMQIVNSRACA